MQRSVIVSSEFEHYIGNTQSLHNLEKINIHVVTLVCLFLATPKIPRKSLEFSLRACTTQCKSSSKICRLYVVELNVVHMKHMK